MREERRVAGAAGWMEGREGGQQERRGRKGEREEEDGRE